jgi:hypothetical protein
MSMMLWHNEQLGFAPAEPADAGPDGIPRQWCKASLLTINSARLIPESHWSPAGPRH